MSDYISREEVKRLVCEICGECDGVDVCELRDIKVDAIPAADVQEVPSGGIGEMSDGYHTFNGLYYQRMVLFAALVNAYPQRAWKSWKHEDGKPCFDGGWFIVGIDTPNGSYTYHYEDKYWNWFECDEVPAAKHFDGHTENDVTRLLSLPDVLEVKRGKWQITDCYPHNVYCSECHTRFAQTHWAVWEDGSLPRNFCPNCGADMREEQT